MTLIEPSGRKPPIKWTPDRINILLRSMKGFRPVGIDKHFHMMFILEEFRSKTGLDVTPEDIWDLLNEYYNLKQLDEMQPLPAPLKETIDFALPSDLRMKN